MIEQPWLGLRIYRQVIVQPRDIRLAERLEVIGQPGVVRLGRRHDLERAVQEIGVESFGPVSFSIATEAEQVVVFDLPKKIFGLHVGEPKNGGLVGGAVDVRHAERIAVDDHLRSKLAGRPTVGSAVVSSGWLTDDECARRISDDKQKTA